VDRLNIISLEDSISHSLDPKLPRLAASHYLNSAPLIWSFIRGSRRNTLKLIDAAPAACSEMLSRKEVEAALVPVIEFQRIPEILLVPDVCVGSRGNVRSVVLVTRKDDLRDVRSVALDESSRTSVTLLKIIFREFLDLDPEWNEFKPNIQQMLSENDAALIIGDPAMTFLQGDLLIFDMASLWREYTGKGFVFAMWAMREDSIHLLNHLDLAEARDEGLRNIEEIVAHYEKQIPLSRNELRTYLTENITYHVDKSMEQGLSLYFDLAFKNDLIEERKPLRFVNTSALID
jgi:chorismate dehydratase